MKNEMIAMLLAGGKGTRLASLTKKNAKPAVYFGGKYRIIDFTLSNCANSNISTVGVLTQYESIQLNAYIGAGNKWGLDGNHNKAVLLPPRQKEEGSSWYNGTADAIIHNLDFIEENDPEYVLILSGDHIYKMNYEEMLAFHKETKAAVTIAAIEVPWSEANRFGIMVYDESCSITTFQEKPKQPASNMASMGVYIFTYSKLKEYLLAEQKIERKEHDFGKHILPEMLKAKEKMVAFHFHGYWKDVGTIESLWEANMDLLRDNDLDLFNRRRDWKIYSEDTFSLPQYLGPNSLVVDSLINQGAKIFGHVHKSVIFHQAIIEEGAEVSESVILPGAIIRRNARVHRAIIDSKMIVYENAIVGSTDGAITLIA